MKARKAAKSKQSMRDTRRKRKTGKASLDRASDILRLRVIRLADRPDWRILANDPHMKVTEYREHGVLVNWRNQESVIPYPKNVRLVGVRYVLDQIDPFMKRLAYMYAYDIRTSDAGGKDRTKSAYQFFNDFKGQLGNLVASYVLLGGDAHATEEVTIGRRDKADLEYKGATIDVKTSEYNGLNLSIKQFEKGSKCAYYVAVKVDRTSTDVKTQIEENWRDTAKMTDELLSQVFTRADMMGYLPTSEAAALATKVGEWYQIPADKLIQITELEEILRNRQAIDSHTA